MTHDRKIADTRVRARTRDSDSDSETESGVRLRKSRKGKWQVKEMIGAVTKDKQKQAT